MRAARLELWLPGATLVLVLLFSGYVIGRPPIYGAGAFMPPGVSHNTIDDFVYASR